MAPLELILAVGLASLVVFVAPKLRRFFDLAAWRGPILKGQATVLTVGLVLFNMVPVQAAGPIGPIGPQGPVGPTSSPGPTSTPGPVSPPILPLSKIGPQLPVGPQGPIGPQAATGTQTSTSTSNATFNNQIQANAQTGDNTVASNTKVGEVKTGSVNGAVTLVNLGNSQLAAGSSIGNQNLDAGSNGQVGLSASNQRQTLVSGSNSQTGPNSSNSNSFSGGNIVNVTSNQNATANNQINLNAQTGGNILTGNTNVAGLQTGDINLAVNVVNLLNISDPNLKLNVDVWSVHSSNPDALISVAGANNQTGPNSINTNQAGVTNNSSLQVTQHAISNNQVQVDANTGANSLSQNSSVGPVSTGSTHVDGSTVTVANADVPQFFIVNVFGPWNGSLQGLPPNSYIINQVNSQTGPDSGNSNTTNVANSSSTNVNQNATANNQLHIVADTGHNQVSNNTNVGGVRTGSVNVLANLVNFLNARGAVPGKFWLGIVNLYETGAAKQPQVPTSQVAVTNHDQPISQVQVTTPANTAPVSGQSGASSAGIASTFHFAISLPAAPETVAPAEQVSDPTPSPVVQAKQKQSAVALFNAEQASAGSDSSNGANSKVPLAFGGLGFSIWLGTEALARRKRR